MNTSARLQRSSGRQPAIAKLPILSIFRLRENAIFNSVFIGVLGAFVVLGIVYSQSTPLLEGPDEMWHYAYVKHIADGFRQLRFTLPRQSENGVKSEAHQPPLYYLLGALITAPINTDDLDTLTVRNPYWGYQALAPGVDNKNIFVHTEREGWPYRGAVLAIRLVRWLSVLLGATTLLGTYLLGLEVFPKRRYLAAGAVALVAFTPQFLFVNSTVSNDSLTIALCTFAVWLMAGLLNGKESPSRLTGLGVVIGLALLTKWTALALLPLAGCVLLYRAWRSKSWHQLWREGLLVFGLGLSLASWWLARNQILYGDPLGIKRKQQIFPPRSPTPTLEELIAELPRKEISYWACFGWENVYADPWVYTVLRLFAYLGLAGLVAFLIWEWIHCRRKGAPQKHSLRWANIGLLLCWVALVVAAFVHWMIHNQVSVGRHLFPAIACTMTLLLLGWTWYLPRRPALAVTSLLGAAFFLLSAVAPYRYIRPVYAGPPRYAASQPPMIAHALEINYDNKVRLLGYDVNPSLISPGQTLEVTLYWEALSEMKENYSVFVHLADENGTIVAQRDSYPGLGHYPTSRWHEGEIIEDTYPIPIPDAAKAPKLKVLAGLYTLASMERLPIINDATHEGNAAEIAWVEVGISDSHYSTGREREAKSQPPPGSENTGG